ncbi:hypothetical protein PC116_g1919 [Phytophthora cactorum]|uniref:Uncharacterized protein n=1 Tax=Phytophthora cactorum TaxID=29920 RepID=A0A8T1FB66_9STRA|nr:hypothetical protein Pcac1_g12090 [Phytophthora cactorum]KAG2801625.1 hypothetical protein PC112_g19959 [Phytophthora cactorum]KAG2802213.1 hypothetical protein PC111_g19209 [Phytophthora cactorum]KAG2880958.1 hypothetical protein PC114_g21803 [Phytophthora cactorum]KAG2902132.1 hypothetical protein PC117_g21549 [Phytophthora cactorum]
MPEELTTKALAASRLADLRVTVGLHREAKSTCEERR